jgi:hypothetical protein
MTKKIKLEDLLVENEEHVEVVKSEQENNKDVPQPISESKKDLFDRLVENFIPVGEEIEEASNAEQLNESLSRGALYRKKYYGRY